MFPIWFNSHKNRRLLPIIVPVILALLAVSVAYATPSPTINTDDTLVDGGWGAPLYASTTNNPNIADDKEIKNAWFQNNSADMNFRIETWASPGLPSGFLAVGILDCNSNSTPNGNPDRNITYGIQYDIVTIRAAVTNSFLGYGTNCGTVNPPGNPPCPDGERTITPNAANFEWKLVNWPALQSGEDYALPTDCRDQIQVAFATVNASNGAVLHQTPYYAWNIPTVVDMKEVKASNHSGLAPISLGLLGLAVLGGLGALVIYRRKRA